MLRELETDYALNDSVKAMCCVDPTFRKPGEDDVLTDDENLLVDYNIEIDSYQKDSEAKYLSPNIDEGDD